MAEGFRFSRDFKFGGLYGFNSFMIIAREMDLLLKEMHPSTKSCILVQDDLRSYELKGIDRDYIKPKREVPLDFFNEDSWERAYERCYSAKGMTGELSEWICLSVERREPTRMFFYGQCLQNRTVDAIMNHFAQPGGVFDNYRIGDGFSQTSPAKRAMLAKRLSKTGGKTL